jgi:type II secretory pathway component PulJ
MSKIRGISLIELVVAMGIFMVISTIAVGAFVTAVRMKSLTSTMKESQQKIRIAMEMITRLSRQANRVESTDGKILYLYYTNTSGTSATRFSLVTITKNLPGPTSVYELRLSDCALVTETACSGAGWANDTNLLGDTIYLDTANTKFEKKMQGSIPTLQIILNGKITGMPSNSQNTYYNDQLSITTSVLLESIK